MFLPPYVLPVERQLFRIDLDRRLDLGRMITPLDFSEPSGIVSVNPKILDSDNMGFVVWNNISHRNTKLLQNPDIHKSNYIFPID